MTELKGKLSARGPVITFCKQIGCFRDSNPWPPSHNEATLSLRQARPPLDDRIMEEIIFFFRLSYLIIYHAFALYWRMLTELIEAFY